MGGRVALALMLLGGVVPWSQEAPKKPVEPPALVSAGRALERGAYPEALGEAEGALAKNPQDLRLQVVKVRALMGLGRTMEAVRLVVPLSGQHPEEPELRYLAGQCAFEMDMVPQAVAMWSALYGRQDGWASEAYVRSAQALLAQGQEAKARELIGQALEKLKQPAPAVFRLALSLTPEAKSCRELVARAAAADPAGRSDWEALERIYAAAGGGRLFEEAPIERGTLEIPLKEKTERVDLPAWSEDTKWSSTVSFSSGSRVTVPAVADGGKKEWMLLDSGANVVLITARLARELHLSPIASAEYAGLGYRGAVSSNWVLLKSLSVGGLLFQNVPAMVLDKDTDFWSELGGIVPLSLFRRHALLYDRRHGKLVLYPSGTDPASVLGDKLYPQKSLWLNGMPMVLTRILDRGDLRFLLDTGATSTYIAAEHAAELGVKVNSGKYKAQHGRGISGMFLSGTAERVDLSLGAIQLQMPVVQVTEIGESYPVQCYGLIGRDVLDNFLLFVDYPRDVLVFKAYDR